MERFDKQSAREILNAVRETLEPMVEGLGLTIKMKGGRYDDHTFTVRFDLLTMTETGEAFDVEANDFKRLAGRFGFKLSDLGREFTSWNGTTYSIKGLNPRNRKYPIITERSDGKQFKMTAQSVRAHLEKEGS
jgi:hypothetical protein